MNLTIINASELKTGDTLLYEKKTFIGRLEQITSRSIFSHTSLVDNISGLNVYEAVVPKYCKRKLKESIKHTVFIAVLRPLFSFDESKYIELCKSLEGNTYSYKEIIFQMFHQLHGGWCGDKSSQTIICSSANAWVYNQLTGLFPDWYKFAPVDFWDDRLNFTAFRLDLDSV